MALDAATEMASSRRSRAAGASPFAVPTVRRWTIYVISIALGIIAWSLLSLRFPPIFLPSPLLTMQTLFQTLATGELEQNALVSLMRILAGWALGCFVGAIVGTALGRIPIVYRMFYGVIEYLRFVPPVTLVTLFIIWFGVGEMSKIVLIAWVSVFIVIVNTAAGAASVREGSVRAARCLGATNRQVLWHVAVPEIVPYLVTGMQIALSNAFMTIVAAEMLAAQSGLGFMIWDAQIYAATDQMFVAFVVLSVLGFCLDHLIRVLSRRMLSHYKVV
jgi:NitT/TauT family transport system permease protein